MNTPNQLFDYDGALADLEQMYERGRKWTAENILQRDVALTPIYTHTLEIVFAMMAFREFSTIQEAL